MNSVLIRYGEMFLKGKNKGYFEKILLNNVKNNLKSVECKVTKISGRYVVTDYDKQNESFIIDQLKKIFGIHSISPAFMLCTNKVAIYNYVQNLDLSAYKTFRITANRADKSFPINSFDLQKELGGVVLDKYPNLKVQLHDAEIDIQIDIRENGKTFIFTDIIPCSNGMPVGTAGRGLLLLSGGIDSPVAGYLMAKRGLQISAVHFHSYPYTSEQAKQKVIELANIISDYTGPIKMFIVSFTKIQEEIHKRCDAEYMITIMRRIMMRIAQRIAADNECKTIITGESLGQVASQTVESITVTNNVVEVLPVLRPLIAMDKEEITEIAKRINTYDTSILPYEDCCTVFLPEHPVIRPTIKRAEYLEKFLDIEQLIEDAVQNIEIYETNK